MSAPKPPPLSRLLLSLLLPARHRRLVLDDLDEEFRSTVASRGLAGAREWYRRQAWGSLRPAGQMRLTNRLPIWREGLSRLGADLRFAARGLTGRPGFALPAVLTLGLGVGVNAAIFTVTHDIMLRPLPYPDSEHLMRLSHRTPEQSSVGISWDLLQRYRRHEHMGQGGLYLEAVVNLTDRNDEAERIRLVMVTGGVFRALATAPMLGRSFLPEEELETDARRLLLAHDLWVRRYGSDPHILGREVDINRVPREVVGVMPPGFAFPDADAQAWLLIPPPESPGERAAAYFESVVRVAPGTTAEELESALVARSQSAAVGEPDATVGALRPVVRGLRQSVLGDIGDVLWPVFVTALLVLVAAGANVLNLLLVRNENGRGEEAVRRALGARRRDLLRLRLLEGLLIGSAAALVGIGFARAAVGTFVAGVPRALPRLGEVAIDGGDALYALAAAWVTALMLSAVATLRRGVKEATRPASTRVGSGPRMRRGRSLAVAAQVAVAMVLLVGAALMTRSFQRLSDVDPGFESDRILTLQISLPFRPYQGREEQFFDRLLADVRALPGVVDAGGSNRLPLDPYPYFAAEPVHLRAAGAADDDDGAPVSLQVVSEGYFETLGIPIVEGLGPESPDIRGLARPVLLSEPLAQRLFGPGSALGRRVELRGDPDDRPAATVVGVVAPIRERSLDRPPGDILYIPVAEDRLDPAYSPSFLNLTIRTTRDPEALAAPVRALVAARDPELPVAAVRPMADLLRASTARTALAMWLLILTAAVALTLGAIGLYGAIAHAMSQRTREIGIRVALGADPAGIRRLVVREGAGPIAVGVVVGGVLSLASNRALASLLYEVAPADPVPVLIAAVVLASIGFGATVAPTRRAARIDPVRALAGD